MRLTPVMVLLALFTAAGHALAEDQRLIAVLPLHAANSGLDKATLETLEEAIRTTAGDELSTSGWTVLTGETTLRILADNGIDGSKACEASCALEAARELKADLFVSGSISRSEGDLVSFVRLFEKEKGRQLASIQLEGATVKELRRRFSQEAAGLFSKAFGKLRQLEEGIVADAPPAPSAPPPARHPAPEQVAKKDATRTEAVSDARPVTFVTDEDAIGSATDSYRVQLIPPNGVPVACAAPVSSTSPCTLDVTEGTLSVSGATELHLPVKLAPGATYSLWHDTSMPRVAGWSLLVPGAAMLALSPIVFFGADVYNSSGEYSSSYNDHANLTAFYAALAGGFSTWLGYRLAFTDPVAGVRRVGGENDWRPRNAWARRFFGELFVLVGGSVAMTLAFATLADRPDDDYAYPGLGFAGVGVVGGLLLWWDSAEKAAWIADEPTGPVAEQGRAEAPVRFTGLSASVRPDGRKSVLAGFTF